MSHVEELGPARPPARTSRKAIASFILSFPALLLPVLPAALGILLGVLGLIEIDRATDPEAGRPPLKGRGLAMAGIILSTLGMVTGCLFPLLLLPAIQAVHQDQTMHSLQRVALAMHLYHDEFARFPPVAVLDKHGKPLYSWRVLLLPYLEEPLLYQRFHRDEPWDSPANRQVLAAMPEVYVPPGRSRGAPYATYVQVIVGPGAIFDNSIPQTRPLLMEGVKASLTESAMFATFTSITDGAANTILLVEAAEPVPWTKPEDVIYEKGHVPPLGGNQGLLGEGPGFAAAFADASVAFIPKTTKAEFIEAWITRAGGEIVPDPGRRTERPAPPPPPSMPGDVITK